MSASNFEIVGRTAGTAFERLEDITDDLREFIFTHEGTKQKYQFYAEQLEIVAGLLKTASYFCEE